MSLIQKSTPIPSPNDSLHNRMSPKTSLTLLAAGLGGLSATMCQLSMPKAQTFDPFLVPYVKQTFIHSGFNHTDVVLKTSRAQDHDFFSRYLVQPPTRDKFLRLALKKLPYNRYLSQVKQSQAPVPSVSPPRTSPRKTEVIQPPTPAVVIPLPRNFMECPLGDLISLMGRMMALLIKVNDKQVPVEISHPLPETQTTTNLLLTRYHLRSPPNISTTKYLSRLVKFNNFNPATLLTLIYYIDLLSHQYQPYFTLNLWTVHRFLLVATMIAQKLMEDFFYTNDHYAKVGGVAISELNCLELDFLARVDWRCVPVKSVDGSSSIKHAQDVLSLYYNQLIELMGKNTALEPGSASHYVQADEDNFVTSYADDDDEVDDDDGVAEDDEFDDCGECPSPMLYQPVGSKHNNDSRGYISGTFSPHLKRRYPED